MTSFNRNSPNHKVMATPQLGYIIISDGKWEVSSVAAEECEQRCCKADGEARLPRPRAAVGGRGSQRCTDWSRVVVPGGLLFL